MNNVTVTAILVLLLDSCYCCQVWYHDNDYFSFCQIKSSTATTTNINIASAMTVPIAVTVYIATTITTTFNAFLHIFLLLGL